MVDDSDNDPVDRGYAPPAPIRVLRSYDHETEEFIGEYDADGLFREGPRRARALQWLRLMGEARPLREPRSPDTSREARRRRRAALKLKRQEELRALCAEIRKTAAA